MEKISPEDVGIIPTGIVQATGNATTSKRGDAGRRIEAAMTNAIHMLSFASENIAKDPKLSEKQKQERITALNNPENVKAFMMKAREQVKDQIAKEHAAEAQRQKDAAEGAVKDLNKNA